MKSIELTKEHKSKLLEMCKILFPEYRLDFHETQVDVNACFEYISLFKDNKDYDQNNAFSFPAIGEFYHWFEFCMIHLADKIFYIKFKPRGGTIERIKRFFFQTFIDSVEGATSGYLHPVDYLYEEFKKLTK